MNRSNGRLALVLHSHIPFVLRHGRWPHGTDWICEAAAESYLPILQTLAKLEKDNIPSRFTITFTPILCEQLADPDFRREFKDWISSRRQQLNDDAKAAGDDTKARLAGRWLEWLELTETAFDAINGDIVGAFRAFEERGRIEIATSAATHGYLPLLSRDESVLLQIRTAVATHEKHFGKKPRGFWLPECAYRPRYEWTPPIGSEAGKMRAVRPGLEELLNENGIEYFVADAHMVHAGEPLSIYRHFYSTLASLRGFEERFPEYPKTRSPLCPYDVKSRGAAASTGALVREPRTSLQIWSRDQGYPGDGDYLDFHRRSVANGIRYYRVTDRDIEDQNKAIYEPERAAARTEEHARHFIWLIKETLRRRGGDGVICSPFDTELFGHWWFEGPLFLEHLFRHLRDTEYTAVSAGDELADGRTRETIQLLEGSWGEGGDHRAWLNRDTEWTWDRLYDAETDILQAVAEWKRLSQSLSNITYAMLERALKQALRELLLLQSSDWQFLITTRAARDYAERRFATHYVELKRLCDVVRRGLAVNSAAEEDISYLEVMERRDHAFLNIKIDDFSRSR
ncbi:MAG: DUF1957 domain-containing protein [Planctomycetes bacterium]|nr:DUF1957 domain-containing protein [Planctomycetota bacterium]